MTLRDFLKANKSLTEFKKMYHELSKTKITYRQIETNLLIAGEDFIINTLNISNVDCGYWVDLNANHFDYRGLIKKGLAIDATGLNIY